MLSATSKTCSTSTADARKRSKSVLIDADMLAQVHGRSRTYNITINVTYIKFFSFSADTATFNSQIWETGVSMKGKFTLGFHLEVLFFFFFTMFSWVTALFRVL